MDHSNSLRMEIARLHILSRSRQFLSDKRLGMPIHEIELMQQAGMTPMQIIVAATRNAAIACNIDGKVGTLEGAKIADILVVDGNPLENLRALTRPRLVLHAGVTIRQ